MVNCQALEKWKSGPLKAHTTTKATAATNVIGCPATDEMYLENREKYSNMADLVNRSEPEDHDVRV